MPRVQAAFRRQLEASLRRIARAATVFIDGDAFKGVIFDPALGQVCADEPDRPYPQYHVDHARFIALKRTLFKLKRLEPASVGIVTWRQFKNPKAPNFDPAAPASQAKFVVAMDLHPCPPRPGIWPISPAMAEAFAGRTAFQEFQYRGRPGLAVCAPVRDSLDDVVGVVEIYASLVPEKADGLLFGETSARSAAKEQVE